MGQTWWNQLRETHKPAGIIYLCPEGHETFVSSEDVHRSIVEEGYEPVPERCPICSTQTDQTT